MQVTNIETVSVQSTGIKFFDGVKALATKITNAFQPKKQPKFTNATVHEAIQFVEWRTKYDQFRIINAVQTATALQQFPELSKALNIVQPTYTSKKWREDRTIVNDSLHKLRLRTRDLLLASQNTKTIHIEVTNNNFERKLVKFFGDLSQRAKDLISGAKVADKTFAHKKMTDEDQKAYRILNKKLEKKLFYSFMKYQGTDADMLSLSHNIKAHEGLIHDYFISQIPPEALEIEVTPVTEVSVAKQSTEVVPVTIKSESKTEDIKKVTKDLNKMTIPKLKAFAKERGLKLSGRTTQISAIRAAIIRQLKENASQQ